MSVYTYTQIGGDVDPLGYGGTFRRDQDGEIWHLVTGDSDGSLGDHRVRVYRWDARFISPFDWADLPEAARCYGGPIPDTAEGQSLIVGMYHGYEELDAYPTVYTKSELRRILKL